MLLPVRTAVALPALFKQVRMVSISFRSLPMDTSVNVIASFLQCGHMPGTPITPTTKGRCSSFWVILETYGTVETIGGLVKSSKLRAGVLSWDHEFRGARKCCEE